MSFDFRAQFTGLCAFVPNKPLRYQNHGDVNNPPTKMMIMMVDARSKRRAPDGEDMRPHFPVVTFNSKDIAGSDRTIDAVDTIWYLDRQQLEFQLRDGEGASFSIIQGEKQPNKANFQKDDDFGWIADMTEITKDHGQIDPKCFKSTESKGLIAARVLLDKGKLSTSQFHHNPEWGFSKVSEGENTSLKGKFAARALGNQATLHLGTVSEVTLVATHIESGERSELRLAPSSGDVRIKVGNLCRRILPLPPRTTVAAGSQPNKDDDFRWFYELVDGRCMLPIPQGKSLPIPRRRSGGSGNSPVRCMMATFGAYAF